LFRPSPVVLKKFRQELHNSSRIILSLRESNKSSSDSQSFGQTTTEMKKER
jgi:hypothetical protein